MIPAATSPWFLSWFARDAEKRIRRTFGEIWIHGLATVKAGAEGHPLLVITNHTSWWDPLVVLFVTRRLLDVEAFAMMDQKNLERLPFFAKVGAFGVDLEVPQDGARGMRYAAKRLTTPRTLVWIFPQGKEVPLTARPLEFRAGSAQIERLAPNALIVPGAIRYVFGSSPLPSLWLSFGEPYAPGKSVPANEERQKLSVAAELLRIDDALGSREHEFVSHHRPRTDWFQFVAERILAFMTRGALHQGRTSSRK